MDIFLTQVFIPSALTAVLNSFWVDTENDLVYMHIEKNRGSISRHTLRFTATCFQRSPRAEG
jgi:hypothetical protein